MKRLLWLSVLLLCHNPLSAQSISGNATITNQGLNVVTFGADSTGSIDSAPAIQAAVNAAAGAPIVIPAGQYKMCSEVDSSIPVNIGGAGNGSGPGQAAQSNTNVSQILLCSATQHGFVVTSNQPSYFHDFQMNVLPGGRPQTAGYGIGIIGAGTATQENTTIERVGFTNVFNPIHALRPGNIHIKDNYFDTWGAYAISCTTSSGTEAGCGNISGNAFFGASPPGTQGPSVYSEIGYTDIHDNFMFGGNYGIYFNITGVPAGLLKVHDNSIENCAIACVQIQTSDGTTVSMVQIANNEFSNLAFASLMTGHIIIAEYDIGGISQKYLDGVQISGNKFRSIATSGAQKYIWVQTGADVQIADNNIYDIGAANPTAIQVSGFISNAGFTSPVLVNNNLVRGITMAKRYAFGGGVPVTVIDPIGLTVATLPSVPPTPGSQIFATDGLPGSGPCTDGSTGAMATFQNGAWKC